MIYNLFLVLSLPFVLPIFLMLAAFNPRYRSGLSERLGFWPLTPRRGQEFAPGLSSTAAAVEDLQAAGRSVKGWPPPSPITHHPSPFFWVHAASVGEVQAVWPLVSELNRRYPSSRFLFTTLTVTGRELVRQKLGSSRNALVRLFPLDLPWVSSRLLKKLRPDLILLVETELWPNFLGAAHRQSIPVVVVNGRISPRAFFRYRMIRWALRPALLGIERFLMQTPADAERIIKLGASVHRVSVLGNLKFDQKPDPLSEQDQEALRTRWGWKASDPVWVSGSTHSGEEESILKLFLSLKKDHPDLRLLLAPRHIERVPEIMGLLDRHRLIFGLSGETYSHHPLPITHHPSPSDVILVNTLGLLGRLYSLAHVVFVGGSLVQIGGHNLMEPALLGKPVLFGPHIQQVQAMADLLIKSGGGIQIMDLPSLEIKIRTLLEDPGFSIRLGEQAREAVHQHQGAVRRTAEVLSDLLGTAGLRMIHRIDRRSDMQQWWEEALWSSRGGGITRLVGVVLSAPAVLYGGAVRIREAGYRVGVIRSKRLSRPVISVGNLTVGGTGKTPTVIAVCELLLRSGLRPAVLSRGYGGSNRAPVLAVSDGHEVRRTPDVAGDEPVLLARKLLGVPVLIGADRVEVGRAAIASYRPDVLVLDDGFQHRRLYRDLDLVLLDSADPFGNGRVLPRGPLREPISHIRRAHAILLTRVESPEAVQGVVTLLHQVCPHRPCLMSKHQLTGWVYLGRAHDGLHCSPSPSPLPLIGGEDKGEGAKRVMVVAGIARPEAFLKSVAQAGLDIAGAWIGPDHYSFKEEDVAVIEQEARRMGAEAILTTEKDAVRLGSLSRPLEGWWAATVELQVFDSKAWEDLILSAVGYSSG